MIRLRLFPFIVFACVLVLLGASSSWATDYYVDFGNSGGSCDDSNNGTSTSTPWCTIPGTRLANDTGWLQSAWGAITNTNELTAGDTVWIKAGTTYTSLDGGRILVGDTGGVGFWDNGTSNSPMAIRVSDSWGSGDTTIDCTGITIPSGQACVMVWSVGNEYGDYMHLRGASEAKRLVIKDADDTNTLNLSVAGTSSRVLDGQLWEYLEVTNSITFGARFSWTDGMTVKDSIFYGNGDTGLVTGDGNSPSLDATIIDCDAYSNGDAAYNDHGFNTFDSGTADKPVVYIRSRAWDNYRDGFDNGLLNNDQTTYILFIDSEAWDNTEDGIACSGDESCSGCSTTCSILHSISYGNGNSSYCGYQDGLTTYLTNSVAYDDDAAGCMGLSGDSTHTSWNNICYKPASGTQYSNCGGATGTVTINADYNIYIPTTADSDSFSNAIHGGGTYDSPPSFITSGTGNKLGIDSPNYDSPSLFVATDSSVYENNDFHAGSGATAAIDAGSNYCSITTATGSGTSFDVDCDPRLYFFDNANRPLVDADIAYVGGTTECTVDGLDSDTITCTSSVSWTQGDGVSRIAVYGSAPDIGVYELASAQEVAVHTTAAVISASVPIFSVVEAQ